MYYGFVGGNIRNVFDDWKKIEKLSMIYPYASYRKFKSEAMAWDWISRRGSKKVTESVTRYGNIFESHYVTVDYIIAPDAVYYNINTSKLGYVKLFSEDANIIIENRSSLILVKINDLTLNKDLIYSHLIAIQNILQIIGPFVDIEFVLPNHAIFYTMTRYTGEKRNILRVMEYIKKRLGSVAWTLREF